MITHPNTRPVIPLDEVHEPDRRLVGGKGAHLGTLTRLERVHVPPGFCVTTDVFVQATSANTTITALLDRLAALSPTQGDEIGLASEALRRAVATVAIEDDASDVIAGAIAGLRRGTTFAVRSSATAEDLPTASFAGQHDSYLGVDAASIPDHIRRCWASLYNERAVRYRLEHGIDHRQVRMAVVVQEQVDADISGVLFTADPATSNRTITTIESTAGLGDALVSGRVNPDIHRVREGRVVDDATVPREADTESTLSESTVLELASLGRRIESHFGRPQDIEWCVAAGRIHVVQARPITTLFPIPDADDGNHVYVSVGHQQMMTDAMKPLGLSMWRLTTPAPVTEAGSRLFVDVTPRLAAPAARAGLLDVLGRSDPLLRDALETIIDRGDFLPPPPPQDTTATPILPSPPDMLDADHALVAALIEANRRSVETARREIETQSGVGVFDYILDDLQELRRFLFDPHSLHAITTGMDASAWLNEQVADWLGDDRPAGNIADAVSLSAPNNVTSEMGLALLDVADTIRPHVDVVAYLEQHRDDADLLDNLHDLAGGPASRDALEGFLDRYGMRCIGEIDITRPRWAERPAALVPAILANIHHFEPGESRRRYQHGEHEAARTERELLERLRALPGGADKASRTKQMIDRVRTFIGYREYPKYGMVSRYHLYKQAMLREAERLVDHSVLATIDDAFYLTFHELRDAAATGRVDEATIIERRDAYRTHQRLRPPRVLTSDGECLAGSVRRDDLPPGALPGLGVSSGIVEGRARVITSLGDANVAPGDILVTAYTDPSWSPLFVTIAGLVTEVGGFMTHGAVVAREYGLPAVVAVDSATTQIRDGQRIRINGTEGYIEVVDDS